MTGAGVMTATQMTVGVEEEYLLVNPETRELVGDSQTQEAVISGVQDRISDDIGFVTQEFLRAQVEVGTAVCTDIAQVRDRLRRLRAAVAAAAADHGVAPIAASTHPGANWHEQKHTEKARYQTLAKDFCALADRLVICGMHVHVGVADNEQRIDLLNQISYFLPHLLALSTSSPFWRGRNTGLKCYRLTVFDELPRTGLPGAVRSWADYQRYLDVLIGVGEVEDGSKIWWDLRPSCRYPTLEMRITDICTNLEDGVSIAALYVCIVEMLQRLRRSNQRWREYSNMLIEENRWRAQRRGLTGELIDFGRMKTVPCAELLEELIELTAEEQQRLNCVAEVVRIRDICARGTSADAQLRVFDAALKDGAGEKEALNAVIDWLIEETVRGTKAVEQR